MGRPGLNLKELAGRYTHSKGGDASEIIFGGGLSFAMKILAACVTLLLNLALTRLLGAEIVGYYFLGVTVLTLLCTFGRLGLDHISVKQLAGKASGDHGIRAYYWFAVSRISAFSCVLSLLLFIFAGTIADLFGKPRMEPGFMLLAFIVVPMAINVSHAFFAQAQKDMVMMQVFFNLLVAFIMLVLISIASLLFELSLEMAIACLLLSNLIGLLLAFHWARTRLLILDSGASHEVRKSELWKAARYLWLHNFPNLAMTHAPILVLGVMVSAEELAYFVIAMRVAGIAFMVFSAINNIVVPKLAESFSRKDIVAVRRLARLVLWLSMILTTPILLVLIVSGDVILGLFGHGFEQGSASLIVLTMGYMVTILVGPTGPLLSTGQGQAGLMWAGTISAAIGMLLCVLLIPAVGIIGAAFAHFTAMTVEGILQSVAIRLVYGFSPIEDLFRRRIK